MADQIAGDPIALCATHRSLVPATLESTLLRQDRPFVRDGWSQAARERGLLLDLSRVEWVELSAAVRAALLLAAARREGINVQVALPLPRPRLSEQFWAGEESPLPPPARAGIQRRVRRRAEAQRFLEYLRFERALTPPHPGENDGRLRVLQEYDSSVVRTAEEWEEDVRAADGQDENIPSLDARRRYAVPLTWLSAADPAHTEKVMRQLFAVLSVDRRGIGRIDAAAISHVLLYELVENAIRHSGAGNALVAAFAHRSDAGPSPDDYRAAEASYMGWVSGAARPGIDLVIGDAGSGLVNVLGPAYDQARKAGEQVPELARGRRASIVAWAFDRRSSTHERERRGTRGLYRVDRLVKRHAGLITARSSDVLVGQDHGGASYDRLVVDDSRLSYVPGTVLRAHIGPVERDYRPRVGSDVPSDLALIVKNLDRGEDGLTLDEEPLEAVLTRAGASACHVLVPQLRLATPKSIDALLAELAEARDPGAVALVGVPNWDEALGACESLNQTIADRRTHLEEAAYDHFDVRDPILLVGESGETAWAGTHPAVARALAALSRQSDGRMAVDDLERLSDASWDEVRPTLRRDTTLVARENGYVRLRLSPTAVVEAIASYVADAVRAQIASGSGRVRMTASLTAVRSWVSIEDVLPTRSTAAAAMAALAWRLRERVPELQRHEPVLTADASVRRERLQYLGLALSAARIETAPSELGVDATHHVSLAEPGEQVVIYGDVVASGESIRRALAQLLRDDARPLAVACIADVRESAGEPFAVWGLEIPVVSLVQQPTVVKVPPGTADVYLSAGGQEERSPFPEPRYEIPPRNLMNVVAEREALHFGHIGGSSGRHFTFYVDASKLLRGPELRDALTNSVEAWLAQGRTRTVTQVWFPTPEPKVPRPAETLARHVNQRVAGSVLRPINREPVQGGWRFPSAVDFSVRGASVVIVDWGALEGTTVTELIRLAAEAGATRVLACLCLSQLRRETEWHLRAMRTVEATIWEAPDALFPVEAADERQEAARPDATEVEVKVSFLSALAVPAFSVGDCPVCSQRATLADQRAATPAIRELIQWQRTQRLHLVAREDTVGRPITDLDDNLLPGSAAVRMLELRRSLEAALASTRNRETLVRRLRELCPAEGERPDDELLDLLRLLAIETPWMRRPPLVFEEVRHLLAEAAASVALATDTATSDRVNAVIVLRTSSKAVFARRAEEIFARNHADRTVTRQLLYGIHTYIQRPYLQTEEVWQPVVDALAGMQRQIASEVVPQHAGKADIDALHSRAVARSRLAQLGGSPLSKVWTDLHAKLGAGFSVHGVGDHARRLAPSSLGVAPFVDGADSIPQEPGSDAAAVLTEARRTLEVDWPPLERFLGDEVVPRLQRLLAPLSSIAGRTAFGPHWVRLTRLLEDQRAVTEWRVARVVRDVLEDRVSLSDARVWGEYASEMQWIDEVILRTRLEGGGPDSEPSRLIALLEQAPTELYDAVRRAAARRGTHVANIDISGVPDDGMRVFFPRASLWDLVMQIVQNVEDHYDPEAAASGGARIWIRRVGVEAEPAVTLVVENTATLPTARRGEFLAKYEEELPAFGGSIQHGRIVDSSLSYRVSVTLMRAVG